MAIRAWWDGNSEQRFWMEATDRPDLGTDLHAPKAGAQGQAVWHYELVSWVRPGDLVLHWHTDLHQRPGIVGWSRVVGEVHEALFPWVAHTRIGRVENPDAESPNWVVPLGELTLLDEPIFGTDVSAMRDEIIALQEELRERYDGFAYFPFVPYRDGLRAQQAYLTKLPAELVELFAGRFSLELDATQAMDADAAPVTSPVRPNARQGFLNDVKRRIAVELHAVDRAKQLYAGLGATEIHELGKPYDLRVALGGQEVHVEVKGSVSALDKVILTRNEVAHARNHPLTELVVVDNINVDATDPERPITSGGRLRRWQNWAPADDSLSALTYEHTLPGDVVG